MPHEPAPLIAAIHYPAGFDIEAVIAGAVSRLRQAGIAIAGVLQYRETDPATCCARVIAVDIRTGAEVSITQERGKAASGCRLDPSGLADMAQRVTEAIEAGADLAVINKFGKAEIDGAGLMSCFAEAISAGLPVLTTVREPHIEAWEEFHGGLASRLPPSEDDIVAWCLAAVSARQGAPHHATA